ncbi:zinc finger protein 385B-like isoform 2-T2 [Clarias gariepinus]|uniref:zinc finger protein 385B-like isoform X2 n=1 Tax=Clarias gariepinus TaxID=13013 RepID=UPI00234DFAD4|nr:zinc finger protein 385B-like isoform X2 [Clarias gariepinus]
MSRLEQKTDCSSQTGPSRLLGVECEASEVKQKRKQQTLTLCEVCNIQLNSSAQAQIHYNGKTHQRRLRQANRAKTSSGARSSMGSPAQGGALKTSHPVQPQMDLKKFLPLKVNSSSPLSLFSNFNVMDPVQKAVISHTLSIAQSLKKKQIITCNICHLRFNSTNQAEAHYKGHKHARKLKAIGKLKTKQRILGKWRERERKKPIEGEMEDGNRKDGSVSGLTAPVCSSQTSNPEDDRVQGISLTLTSLSHTSITKRLCESKCVPECPALVPPADQKSLCESESVVKGNRNQRKCIRSLQCPVCKVTVNSGSQLEDHYKGFKHRLMLGGHCTLPRKRGGMVDSPRTMPCPKRPSIISTSSDQSHRCSVCDVDVNSEAQLRQHMSSRRHRDRATGKSHLIKYSPYSNNSAQSVLTTKLTLQKELFRTLNSSFLTSALTPASLCAVATGPLSLSHVHPPPAIVHAPLFSPTLFRPALEPLRAAHGPIVFSPY